MILASVTLDGIPWSAQVTVRFEPTSPEPVVDYLSNFQVYVHGCILDARYPVPDYVLESLAAVAFSEFGEMTAADLERHRELER